MLSAVSLPLFGENDNYTISHIIYNIDGQTKKTALKRYMDIKIGDSFSSYAEMDEKSSLEVQKLINLRLFQEGSFNLAEDENSNYILTINLKDGWKIYPIPYPKYDSNKGFRLGMEFYYFNVGGSLLNFFIEGAVDLKLVNNVLASGDWKMNPSLNNLKIGEFLFSVEVYQSFANTRKIENLVLVENFDVYNTNLIITSKMRLPGSGFFFYEIAPELDFAYGFTDYLSNAAYIPIRFNWNHSIAYDHVNWIGFQKEGFYSEFSNSLGISSINNQAHLTISFSGEILYFHIWKIVNPSMRFYVIKSFNEDLTDLGENMRGLLDAHMFGQQAVFLNLSLDFPIIDINEMFEIHLQPFIDMGTVFKTDFRLSAGTDIILFADVLSSIQFRFSFGADLNSLFTDEPDMFELEISSSLAY